MSANPSTATVTAQRITPLPGIVAPSSAERTIPSRLGQCRSQVTAFDLSTDGTTAAVLTYGNIWVYQRRPSDDWVTTFMRAPARIPVEGLPQAEALCFDGDSHDLIVTTERGNAALQRYPAKSWDHASPPFNAPPAGAQRLTSPAPCALCWPIHKAPQSKRPARRASEPSIVKGRSPRTAATKSSICRLCP
ncbi:MAG: hypothetical protein J6386_15320 [Candidatus Synoicihabitans palmerolidicus]|nr:hypothetical protein [Candidatus Synoicihabitans palmerolidicus]